MAKRIIRTQPSPINAVIEAAEGELFYSICFVISDLDTDNNPITDSNVSKDVGFYTNSITDIQITDIVQYGKDDNDSIPENITYPEASLLVENRDSQIVYTLVNSEGLFIGILEDDGSIVLTDNRLDPDIEILSFTPDSSVLFGREIDLDLAVNSLDYIIEENLFVSLDFEILGTDGDDILTGRDGDDTLIAGEGQDTLIGNAGEDEILGENGDDLLRGKEGNDALFGGNDEDEIFGDSGNDFVEGGNGNDTVFGGTGNDNLFGSPGDDQLYGDEGNDLINGDDDNDNILGGIGNDSLSGGNGNDTLSGGNDNDIIEGNSGNDLLIGGSGNDILAGGADADVFELATPNDLAFATIIDLNRVENDKIQITGSKSDYALNFGTVSGDAALDTLIEYQGNTIAIVEDTVTIDLNTDFVFL